MAVGKTADQYTTRTFCKYIKFSLPVSTEYIHQVRSYNRSISVTMLFTENPDGTFTRRGCDEAKFEYTPLSKVRVHWTYNKGDSVIEMGYMNVEMLRMSVVHSLEQFNTDKVMSQSCTRKMFGR